MTNRVDTFIRADGSIGTPSDAGSAWVVQSGTWNILSNQAREAVQTSQSTAVLESSVSSVDVQATFSVLSTDCGLVSRVADDSNYILGVVRNAGSADIYKRVAGSFTNLGTYAGAFSNGDVIKLTSDGTDVHTLSQNGSARITTSADTAGSTNTKHGLRCSSDNVTRFTAFSITALGGGTSVALTGVSGTGSVGSVSPAFDKALTGVSGTGSVGSVSPALSIALTGVSGTGSVGSVSPSFSIPLTGVTGTGTVGTLTPNTGVFVALTGVTGTGSVGSVAPEFSIGLTGVSATGSVGSLGFPSDASGVTPGFRNFGLPNINRGETQDEKRARWVREGSLPTEPSPEIQDKPAPKPIDDAKAAKLREARLRIQADSARLREKIDAIEAKETTARREKDLLRAQQALQLKTAEEAFVNEQLEVIDIAYVAMTVIRYTAGISTTAIF